MAEIGFAESLLCGAVGAAALTTVHQVASHVTDEAPQMDVVGMRALAGALRGLGTRPPAGEQLYGLALAGDLVSNGLFYSLVSLGRPRNPWVRGTALGLAAGIGALLLPRRIGLGDPPRSHSIANQMMTLAWYLVGGLSAAATAVCLRETRVRAREVTGATVAGRAEISKTAES